MMDRWQLTVWTRFRASLEEVWALKTDVRALDREFRPLRLRLPDVEGLQRALRGGAPGRFDARLGGPLGILTLAWPIVVEASEPMREFRDASDNALLRGFAHRHRFEPSGDGHVRYVDEVRFTPGIGPSRLSAELTRRLFVRRHLRAARDLPVDPRVVGISVLRRYDPRTEG